MIQNKNNYPSLNVNNGKPSPYGSKGILRHYHYRPDTKFGRGIVSIGTIQWSWHYYTTILSLTWDSTIKERIISQDILEYIIASTL